MFEFIVKGIAMAIGAAITYLFGGWDILLQFLILIMMIDYFTGLYKAYSLKELSSKVGFTGVMKKVLILVVVAIAHGLDIVFTEEGLPLFGFDLPVLRTIIIWAYIINELVSILENMRDLNIYIPKALHHVLDKLKKSQDDQNHALVHINVHAKQDDKDKEDSR
ncbi:phage holin family protein [Alkalihalobacillus sp. LMS6]|uniref:phage holin family protein n=1 Tax=Alkalihalobacillus sp. LMS6 TaxID=2924034 RepID=UPI0020D0799E|nr:phage holin family protein [Alkalihalobacillus sp. LMS6]UTR06115.1 phage holin family protein [Alkalihalobacillus sp. LMS6]